jgi:phosphatidylinositol 3-kinase
MLMLMDKLLQDQGLDLQLTTYHVLATAPGQGLVQLVPDCLNLAQILAESKNDIRRYLQAQHPAPDAPYGIEPSVFERFVKSSAGYCVTM